jgi:hypothetical protein
LHGGPRSKGRRDLQLENEKAEVAAEAKQKKPNKKKKGKIAQVYKLHQKGVSVKEIAEKMKLSERIVRSYIWRMKNPEKYRALLQRYFAKKKQKQEEIKLASNNAKRPKKKKEA